jgi:hypothetical protein
MARIRMAAAFFMRIVSGSFRAMEYWIGYGKKTGRIINGNISEKLNGAGPTLK